MKEKAVKKFLRLYGGSFPLRKRFNFTGFCNDVKSLIDEDYDHLLMKNQEVLTKNKKKELFKKKFYMELKEIEVDKNIMLEKKKKKYLLFCYCQTYYYLYSHLFLNNLFYYYFLFLYYFVSYI